MEFLAKSRIAAVLGLIAASSVLFAQNGVPDKLQDHASIPDPRHIIGQSVLAAERSLEARDRYTYVQRDQDRRLDAQGQLKSEKVDITRMILVNGARFEQLVERNGRLPSPEEQKKLDQDFEKLKHETPEERTARLGKERENRSFLRDMLDGFDFRLLGEEVLGGRSTYVLQATPHPGYHARGKYGKMLRPLPIEVRRKNWERLRPMDPDRFAHRVLRAVAKNKAIIIIPTWWKVFWWINRISPSLGLYVGRKLFVWAQREWDASNLEIPEPSGPS